MKVLKLSLRYALVKIFADISKPLLSFPNPAIFIAPIMGRFSLSTVYVTTTMLLRAFSYGEILSIIITGSDISSGSFFIKSIPKP